MKGVVLSSSERSQVRKQTHKRKKHGILGKLEKKSVYFCKWWILRARFNSVTVDCADEYHIKYVTMLSTKVTHHRRRLQTAFEEGLWQLSHNLAVNRGSTKMRHNWTQWQTIEAPHTTTIASSQVVCKKTACFIYFCCKQGFDPWHCIWLKRNISNALNALHDHSSWFQPSTFSNYSKKMLKALTGLTNEHLHLSGKFQKSQYKTSVFDN